MSQLPDALWLNVSPALKGLDRPLLKLLSQHVLIAQWEYLQGWQSWLKPGDCLWQCPKGRYFFHYFQPQQVADKIVDFWTSRVRRDAPYKICDRITIFNPSK